MTDRESRPEDERITELCRAFQRGSGEALDQLVRLLEGPLARFLAFLTSDPSEAADLAQTVWLQVIRKRESLQNPARFKAWLFRIAQRLFLMSHRRGRVLELPEDVTVDEPTPLDLMVIEERKEEMLAAVQDLAPDRKMLLWLSVVEGWPHAETAQALEIPEGTVRSRLHYTLKGLKETLQKKEGSRGGVT